MKTKIYHVIIQSNLRISLTRYLSNISSMYVQSSEDKRTKREKREKRTGRKLRNVMKLKLMQVWSPPVKNIPLNYQFWIPCSTYIAFKSLEDERRRKMNRRNITDMDEAGNLRP